MPSTKSGGARETARKHREREAARPEGYAETARERIEAAFNADPTSAGAGREAVSVLRAMLRERVRDPGVDLATMIQGAAPIASMLAKASEPEKRVEILTNDLRELGEEVDRLKDRHAARVTRATAAATPPPALAEQH